MANCWTSSEFSALYREHGGKLFGLALRLRGGHQADAEDLVQQTWLRAAGAAQRFEGRAAMSSWLCGILVNVYRENTRKARRTPPEPATTYPFREHLDLERLLARLPVEQREVIILHDMYGFSHDEIAALLDIAEGTSKSRLSRARSWCREQLQNPPEVLP